MSVKQRRISTLQHFLPQSRFVKSASICENTTTTITITYKTVLVKGGGEKTGGDCAKPCPPRPKQEAMAIRNGRQDKKSYSTALLANDTQTDNSPKRSEDIPRVSVSGEARQLVICQNLFPFMQAGRIEISPEVFKKLKMESALHLQDCRDQRFSVLSYEQVTRLSDLMNEVVAIHGRGNFPTLEVKLVDLVVLVRTKLEADGVPVKEIRLNGSGASSVLASNCNISYNDLDLIFTVDLPTQKHYERVKQAVLDSLLDLLPEGTSKKRMSSCTLKEAYVSKMVKVNDSDRWSLIALGNNRAKSVELKFVDRMKRKYEFSVDSFHIMLDTLFLFYSCAKMPISDNFYPTVVGESVYGNFEEALLHLHKKLIATKQPEEIRGGGLLKYCNLLVKNYRPAQPEQVKSMEKYMCSRFFIDFPDLSQQHNKLVKFLHNHFQGSGEQLMYDYLMILYQVVDESTVCLMGHERRQTLALIEDLSCSVYASYEDGCSSGYHTPSSWDTASTCSSSCSSSSSSSTCSSEQYSPLSTTTSSPSLSPKPADVNDHHPHHHQQHPNQQHHQHYPLPHNFSVPPPQILQPQHHSNNNNSKSNPMGQPPPSTAVQQQQQLMVQPQQQQQQLMVQPQQQQLLVQPQQQQLVSQPQQQQQLLLTQGRMHPVQPKQPQAYPNEFTQTIAIQKVEAGGAQTGGGHSIPTYEIITSCQPRVVYSNGYYITSFSPPAPTAGGGDSVTADVPCYTLSTTSPAAPPAVVSTSTAPPLLYSVQATAPCFSCSCIGSGAAATHQWTITKSTMLSAEPAHASS